MELKDRELAVRWWKRLEGNKKVELAGDYVGRVPASLTDREIEYI